MMIYYERIHPLEAEMESDKKRSVNWLSTALIGALMVITGGMIIFFPKAAISMVMVMAAVPALLMV